MEEDIKLLEEWVKESKQFEKDFNFEKFFEGTRGHERILALENLINKYKELRQKMLENRNLYSEQIAKAEKEIHRLKDKIDDLEFENKEQEKMIEIMADSIKHYKTVGDGTLNTRPATREEKIGWFRMKAKGE